MFISGLYFRLVSDLKTAMKVRIKRKDPSLPLPRYETKGAVGFDIVAAQDTMVEPKEIGMVPTGLIVSVPDGYMLVVASRSSTPMKKGLTPPHGFGIIDQDYCGPEDEIKVLVYNFKDEPMKIERGEKIAQGVFVKVDTFEWDEAWEMQGESRGGFGSTGGYNQ